MKAKFYTLLIFVGVVTGCTQTGADRARPDEFAKRRTVVGSNIPLRPGQLTDTPAGATTPSQSVARDQPSLYPVQPVLGRGPANTDPGVQPANVGAGPAGSNPVGGN